MGALRLGITKGPIQRPVVDAEGLVGSGSGPGRMSSDYGRLQEYWLLQAIVALQNLSPAA